jgi:hypothetical protein
VLRVGAHEGRRRTAAAKRIAKTIDKTFTITNG